MNLRDTGKKSITSERELLDLIRSIVDETGGRLRLSLGDDAAIIGALRGNDLVFTIDSFLGGIHFEIRWGSNSEIGHRAMAGALSDIAAMGARPVAAFVSLGLPSVPESDQIKSLYRGFLRCADRFGCAIAGGETVRTKVDFVITIGILGEVKKGTALTRSGAVPGDHIYVSGWLGGARAALRCLETECGGEALKHRMRGVFFGSLPRIDEAEYLRMNCDVSAMIDISDGLSTDLYNLVKESGVGAVVCEKSLPVSEEAVKVSELLGEDILDYVLNGGEEYELLFTVHDEVSETVRSEFARRFGLEITPIGTVSESGMFIESPSGKRSPLVPEGYDHMRRRNS